MSDGKDEEEEEEEEEEDGVHDEAEDAPGSTQQDQEESEEDNDEDDDDEEDEDKDKMDDSDEMEESNEEFEEEEEEDDDDDDGGQEDEGLFSTAAVYHPTSKYEEPVYDMARRYPSWPMLTLYDIHRRPRRVPSGRWHCSSSMRAVLHAFRCVICLSTLNKPKAVRECMHRFCEDCIEKSLRMGRNECPFCRVFVPSKRNLAVDSSVEHLIQNVLGPELRNLEHEELEDELEEQNDDDDDTKNNVEEKDEDIMGPRLTRAKRRAAIHGDKPPPSKRHMAAHNAASTNHNKGNDDENHGEQNGNDDDDDDEENSVNPPALFDFHLLPHKEEHFLEPLQLPYIRITGDATVKTIIKFVQAKLSCDKPLQITSTTSRRRLPDSTPLYMVGSLTNTLHYRLPPQYKRKTSTTTT